MRQMLASKGLSLPTFDSDRSDDSFTAIFLFHHFLNESDWEWLNKFSALELSEDQMRALVFVREVGAIDNSTYRSLTQTDTLAASHSLRRLKSLDLLAARGNSSKTYYVAGPLMEAVPDISNLEGKSRNLEVSEASLEVRFEKINIQEVPANIRQKVRIVALGGRLKPDQAKNIIFELCKWRPLGASELASLLQKSAKHLTDAYLYPMIKSGELRYLYPEMVNHPNQKYRSGKTLNPD